MADIELVIKIPEYFYEYCKTQTDATEIQLAVKNGMPLPKGHGDLIDVNDIEYARYYLKRDFDYDIVDWDDIKNAPIIIKADKEE